MKNQNDLIISIVAIVLALIIAGVCLGTKREPATIPAPETVNLTPAALPAGDVIMANSLPSGSNNSGPGGGGRGFGGGGGALSPMGPGGPVGPGGMRGPGGPGMAGAPGAPGGKQMPGPAGVAKP